MRKIVIAAVFLAVVASAFWYAKRRDQEALDEARKESILATFDDRAVEAFWFQDFQGNQARFRLENDAWRMVEPVSDAANESVVSRVISNLKLAKVSAKIEDPGPLAEYGLKPPVASIELLSAGEKVQLRFGKITPDGEGVFFNRDGSTDVGILDNAATFFVTTSILNLRDASIPGMPRASVKEFVLITDEEEITFTNAEGQWSVTEPFKLPANSKQIEQFLDALYSANIEQLLDGVLEESPGMFDEQLRITLKGAEERTVTLGGSAGENQIYFVRDDRDTLIRASLKTTEAIPNSSKDLLSDEWTDLNRYEVQSIQFSHEGRQIEISATEEGTWQSSEGVEIAERKVLVWLAEFFSTPVSDWKEGSVAQPFEHAVTFKLKSGDEVQFSWSSKLEGVSSAAPDAMAVLNAKPPFPPKFD